MCLDKEKMPTQICQTTKHFNFIESIIDVIWMKKWNYLWTTNHWVWLHFVFCVKWFDHVSFFFEHSSSNNYILPNQDQSKLREMAMWFLPLFFYIFVLAQSCSLVQDPIYTSNSKPLKVTFRYTIHTFDIENKVFLTWLAFWTTSTQIQPSDHAMLCYAKRLNHTVFQMGRRQYHR